MISMLLVASSLLLIVPLSTIDAAPTTWTVDDDGPADFHSIQEAINAAGYRDIISIRKGIYYENVVVNKTVSLVGEEQTSTIIDSNMTFTYAAVKIDADYVSMTGLTVRNCWQAGIMVTMFSDGITLTDNIIVDNTQGIYVDLPSEGTLIQRNYVRSNLNDGINLVGGLGTHSVVSHNTVEDNRRGITLNGAKETTVANNTIISNLIGVFLWSATFNELDGNTVRHNTGGLVLVAAGMNVFTRNEIRHNEGMGMQLSAADNNVFYQNHFENDLQVDIVRPSPWGPSKWNTSYPTGGNYWSDYNGTDLMRGPFQNISGPDGIGDTPYILDEDNVDPYPLMNPLIRELILVGRVGGITDPPPGTYILMVNATVDITAIPQQNYIFDRWERDGVNIGSANPYVIRMGEDYVLKAVFLQRINATVETPSQPFNVRSKGRNLTMYVELLGGYAVSEIDVSTVAINDSVFLDQSSPFEIGDYDHDEIPDLQVQFNRTDVAHYILSTTRATANVTLSLGGRLYQEIVFEGYATIEISVLPGDVNCDGKVDTFDVVQALKSYGSYEDDPNWNPNANFASPENCIDLYDLVTIAYFYGRTHP